MSRSRLSCLRLDRQSLPSGEVSRYVKLFHNSKGVEQCLGLDDEEVNLHVYLERTSDGKRGQTLKRTDQ